MSGKLWDDPEETRREMMRLATYAEAIVTELREDGMEPGDIYLVALLMRGYLRGAVMRGADDALDTLDRLIDEFTREASAALDKGGKQ